MIINGVLFSSLICYESESVSHSIMSDSLVTPWTVVLQTPLSMKFSRQEYWSGQLFPSPEDLPNLGFEPGSPLLKADALLSEPPGKSPRILGWVVAYPFSSRSSQPGIEPVPPALEGRILTTDPPGKPLIGKYLKKRKIGLLT